MSKVTVLAKAYSDDISLLANAIMVKDFIYVKKVKTKKFYSVIIVESDKIDKNTLTLYIFKAFKRDDIISHYSLVGLR